MKQGGSRTVLSLLILAVGGWGLMAFLASLAHAQAPATQPAPEGFVALKLNLPQAKFKDTPKNAPPKTRLEKPAKGPRPPLMVPPGTANLAAGKTVTSSDSNPVIGTLSMANDGKKEADEGNWVELGPGVQWLQVDLGKPSELWAILVWHYHGEARVFRDVIIQVSDDPEFKSSVRTLFNNDDDDSSGLGKGEDYEYFETNEGKLVQAKGAKARYVRLYSNGSTADDQNQYTEVEIHGIPPR